MDEHADTLFARVDGNGNITRAARIFSIRKLIDYG